MAILFRFGHLDPATFAVKVGDRVKKGQRLGSIGRQDKLVNGGFSPHLHFDAMHDGVALATFPKGWSKANFDARFPEPYSVMKSRGFTAPVESGFWSAQNHAAYSTNLYGAPTYHPGYDLNFGSGAADVGKPVYSVCDGVVRIAQFVNGWGGFVVIEPVEYHDIMSAQLYRQSVETPAQPEKGIAGVNPNTVYEKTPQGYLIGLTSEEEARQRHGADFASRVQLVPNVREHGRLPEDDQVALSHVRAQFAQFQQDDVKEDAELWARINATETQLAASKVALEESVKVVESQKKTLEVLGTEVNELRTKLAMAPSAESPQKPTLETAIRNLISALASVWKK